MKHLHIGKPLNRAHHVDVRIENHGSLYLFRPLHSVARNWLQDNTPDDANWFGGALVVEPRYAADLLTGIRNEGMVAQ